MSRKSIPNLIKDKSGYVEPKRIFNRQRVRKLEVLPEPSGIVKPFNVLESYFPDDSGYPRQKGVVKQNTTLSFMLYQYEQQLKFANKNRPHKYKDHLRWCKWAKRVATLEAKVNEYKELVK
jgi:hypothetical protein